MDEQLLKNRMVAKGKFTRKVNLLREAHARKDPLQVLHELFDDVCEQFSEVEKVNDQLINSVDASVKNYEEVIHDLEVYITHVERVKNEMRAIIAKVVSDQTLVKELPKIKIQPLTPPQFNGKIREYPTFRKDYERLMTPIYEEDPYVLRSCLSGEALEAVQGVDDSFQSMIKRLDTKYGSPSKLVQSVLSDIKTLKPVPESNSRKFINMVDIVEKAYLDLEKLNLSGEMNTVTMVSQIEKLLPLAQKREWVKILQKITDKDKMFCELLNYLLKEKEALEYMDADVRVTGNYSKVQVHAMNLDSEPDPLSTALTELQSKQNKMEECLINLSKQMSTLAEKGYGVGLRNHKNCWYHGTNTHDITQCTGFQRLNCEDKIDAMQKMGACFLCLQLGHMGRQCTHGVSCSECGKNHHRMLHDYFIKPQEHMNSNLLSRDGVLLMLSLVYSNARPISTLWDPGSNMTLITNRMAKQLGLKGKSICLAVTKVGNECNKFETLEYDVPLCDRHGVTHVVRACGISEVTSEMCQVDTTGVASLLGVRSSDIERPYGKIDMLVGSDYCGLLPSVVHTVGNLQLMHGPFGYCIRGSHPLLKVKSTNNTHVCVRINHVAGISYVNDLFVEPKASVTSRLDDFFSVENLGTYCIPKCGSCKCGKCPVGSNKYSIKEERELSLITQGLTHDPMTKRWTASYPWIKNPENLPNNFSVSLARLRSTEKRLAKRGDEYVKAYSDQIQNMVSRGVARKLTDEEMENYRGPVHYLPHHEVLKPDSKSTPMRIVFNSSASYMGHSLNDYYAKGPDVLGDLFGILLRFRQKPVAIVGDISKMYNSILISELDQMTHRFLWRDMITDKEPDHYCLETVTFGDRPSGIISITALHKTAEMFTTKYPKTAAMIIKDSYVDDILHSCETVSEALSKINATDEILKVGGFQMKQWVVSCDLGTTQDLKVIDTEVEKVLGMIWEPKEDQFSFKVRINFSAKYKNIRTGPNLTVNEILEKVPKPLTKRMILSQVAALYDPLGIANPFTIQCKLLMRQLITFKLNNKEAEQQLGWDDPVPDEMYNQWVCLFRDMYELEKVKFKRCIKPDSAIGNPTLVMYSDASNVAYSTCAYIRFKLQNGTYSAQLLAAKSRIAPIRQITIPRLELCAAVLSSRLRNVIKKETNFVFEKVFHIVDSLIVRSQIQKESHGFGTFVGTRIAEIQTLTDTNEWWWVASDDNAADYATRPQHPSNLGSDSAWQKGPEYLTLPVDQWPISQPCVKELPNRKSILLSCNIGVDQINKTPIIDIHRFSCFERMIKTTAIILNICKQRTFRGSLQNLTSDDLKEAERYWIKIVQNEFKENWEGRFKRLGPSIDEGDVIVVGERISNWLKDNWNQSKFILLSKTHPFTRLYIKHLHNIDHGGVDLTLAKLQSRFWVPGARKVIKSVKEKCVTCKRIDKVMLEQQMGQLPDRRLKPSPAFFNTSLDLFGPIMIRDTVKRRARAKVYGVIFTCLASRAVHIDLMEGYDTNSFLSTFRRFVSVRGYPHTIHSDMGTQLTAASKEIRDMTEKWNINQISKYGIHQGTTWSFNKSANAPWQNGACESLIKSMKRLLGISVGENVLSFGELQTVLFEVANLLNERPIGMKPGYDLNLGAYLCPNDLLLGRASNRVPSGPMIVTSDTRKRFNLIQSIVTTFWRRWMRDYFPTLTVRQKWHTAQRNMKKGDVVLVQDSDLIRGNWKLAQVFEAEPGRDGKVRDVVLRYKPSSCNNQYDGKKDRLVNRSVHRLVLLLPVEEQ